MTLPHNLTDEQRKAFKLIASHLKAASQAIDNAIYAALINGVDGRAMDRLNIASEAVSGLSYLFTPQSEWLGDDADGVGKWAVRAPYIVR